MFFPSAEDFNEKNETEIDSEPRIEREAQNGDVELYILAEPADLNDDGLTGSFILTQSQVSIKLLTVWRLLPNDVMIKIKKENGPNTQDSMSGRNYDFVIQNDATKGIPSGSSILA